MRYKLFDSKTGEPVAFVDFIRAAILAADSISMQTGFDIAIKDERTGAIIS